MAEIKQRVTADVTTNLHDGRSESRLVDVGELQVVGRSLVPVADKVLSGRNNNIRVSKGRPSVESQPKRNYRKTSGSPIYSPADREKRRLRRGRRGRNR